MVTVFNNSTRSNAAGLILVLHVIPLRNVKGYEEYQPKIREANSVLNIEDTGQLAFCLKVDTLKKKKCLSLYFLFSWIPLHCYFTPVDILS